MEEHNFLEQMVALALEDDKGCCMYVCMIKHYLSDYLEVESQSATHVTIYPVSHGLGQNFAG